MLIRVLVYCSGLSVNIHISHMQENYLARS
jgi:hypothetical protein